MLVPSCEQFVYIVLLTTPCNQSPCVDTIGELSQGLVPGTSCVPTLRHLALSEPLGKQGIVMHLHCGFLFQYIAI